MKRLFIATKLELNSDFTALADKLQRQTLYDQIVWTEKEVRHLTVRFLGKTPDSKLEPLIHMLDKTFSSAPCFDLEISKLGVFGSRYQPTVLWLGFKEYQALSDIFYTLEPQLKALEFEPNQGNFVPHLTLGRIKKIDNKKRFWEIIENSQPTFTQTVKVSEISLYQSKLTNTGPIYRILKNFPLADY